MQDPAAFVMAMAQIGAAIALLNGMLVPIGQGNVVANAITGMARQPEAGGTLMTNMFVGCGFCETSGVYGLVIAFILLFANPIVNQAVSIFH